LGIKAQIDFLFAVFDDEKTAALSVFYRGEIASVADGHLGTARLVALSEIPWDELPDFATQSMLRRYVSERTEDRFGIYVGTSDAGMVRGLDHAT
jgi:hypothetical protein